MGRTSRALGAASIFFFAVLAACVGDDPTFNGGGDFDGGSTDFDSGGTSGSSGADTGTPPMCAGNTVDACGPTCAKCVAPMGGTTACTANACAPACPAMQTVCTDTCVDTNGSQDNCGACGHSCGAGVCNGGFCQPFVAASGFGAVHTIAPLADGIVISADTSIVTCTQAAGCTTQQLTTVKAGVSQLGDITTAGTEVYYRANQGDFTLVFHCPATGCPAAGPTQVENIVNDGLVRVVAGPNDVLWTRDGFDGPYSNKCSLPACATVAAVRAKGTTDYSQNPAREQVIPSAVTSVGTTSTLWGTGGLFNDTTKNLRSCPLTGCTTPNEIPANGISALTFYNGQHYGVEGASGGGVSIFSVPDANPTAVTVLAADASGVNDIAVDASGIYWSNATSGKILRCKALTGCTSPETLATGQTGMTHIRLDSKYVYWSLATQVMKLAK